MVLASSLPPRVHDATVNEDVDVIRLNLVEQFDVVRHDDCT